MTSQNILTPDGALQPKKKKTTRDTVLSVAVLAIIALVCVALLSVANEYLKYEAKLDLATAGMINDMVDIGVSDEETFSEGYLKLYGAEELAALDFDLAAFNKGRNNNNGVINAVYGVVKGGKAYDYAVVEVGSHGYYDMTILVAFDKEKRIAGIKAKSETEDKSYVQIFESDRFEAFVQSMIGKTDVPVEKEILISTGATTKRSVKGLYTALNAATECAKHLDGLFVEPTEEGEEA